MPKTNETQNTKAVANPLNTLANQMADQLADYQLRMANYFTPFGFDPELVDFERAATLLAEHGRDIAETVFKQASENMRGRVAHCADEYLDRLESLTALKSAGAEVTTDSETLFTMARSRIFSGNAARAA